MSMKVVILGANGMAGHVIARTLRSATDFNVITVARDSEGPAPDVRMDVTAFDELEALIRTEAPDAVINGVGLLNKTAEDHPDRAILLNSYLPHFLEAVTKNSSCKVIHISTDCVFSGQDGGAYPENAAKNGAGFYAQSKALGELLNDKDLTIRTSIIGPELKNDGIGLFHWFMRQKGEIKGYTNAFWSGVTTVFLAQAIADILKVPGLCGLVHLTNNHRISKFDLVSIFKRVFDVTDLTITPYDAYHVDKSLINTRTDFIPHVPSYEQMVQDMKCWIGRYPELYAYL